MSLNYYQAVTNTIAEKLRYHEMDGLGARDVGYSQDTFIHTDVINEALQTGLASDDDIQALYNQADQQITVITAYSKYDKFIRTTDLDHMINTVKDAFGMTSQTHDTNTKTKIT